MYRDKEISPPIIPVNPIKTRLSYQSSDLEFSEDGALQPSVATMALTYLTKTKPQIIASHDSTSN